MNNQILPPQLEGWDPNDPQPSADFDADEYMMAMSQSPMGMRPQPQTNKQSLQTRFNTDGLTGKERAIAFLHGQAGLDRFRNK